MLLSAGADDTATVSVAKTLAGSASGGEGSLTALWTLSSGPGGVVFVDDEDLTTDATFDTIGAYVLLLTITDGGTGWTAQRSVTYTVSA